MNNERNNKELKLSYTIPIIISLIAFLSYIIFDFISTVRTTIWIEIAFKLLVELFLSLPLIIIIFFFLAYIFLEGLQFTDNAFLKNFSKRSYTFYNLGFEFTFISIPVVIFYILLSFIILFVHDSNLFLVLFLVIFLLFIAVLHKAWKYLTGSWVRKLLKSLFLLVSILIFFGLMQFITAEVNIIFDRNYYQTNDYVIITIDKSGIPPPENIMVDAKNVFLKSSNKNETDQITSNQGIKKVVIYKIDNSFDFGNFNYNVVEVDVNYSVKILWWKINKLKAASFIILK